MDEKLHYISARLKVLSKDFDKLFKEMEELNQLNANSTPDLVKTISFRRTWLNTGKIDVQTGIMKLERSLKGE